MRTTPVASTAWHLAPATLAPAFVATARTTALATSDHRHHALAPGGVRRFTFSQGLPLGEPAKAAAAQTLRQSPPANGKNRGTPSSTVGPTPDSMRTDLGQATHETVQTGEGLYSQGLPLDPVCAALYKELRPSMRRMQSMSAKDFRRMPQVRGGGAAQPDNQVGTGPVRKPRQHTLCSEY